MASEKVNNPMSEFLLKLQLIVSNTEFKNKEEADKYETMETRLAGDDYVDAVLEKDTFESYDFSYRLIKQALISLGYPDEKIVKCLDNPQFIPMDVRNALVKKARELRISGYREPNKYYLNLTGKPLEGVDPVFPVEEAFYQLYMKEGAFHRECPIHLLPTKYLELYQNSDYYKILLREHPDVEYLRHMGYSSIPLEVSRKAKDGEIMKINMNKLSTSHEIFGQVSVSSDIVHQFVNTYKKTHRYIYQTLRGDFSYIYPNYNSLIRLLTIYFTIGTCMNEFMHKSTKLVYMNNVIANDYFTLYGLPSVLMESNSLINFLKKFRELLMDKGTNTVYRVKDIIGYEYTDIYTLVMVKQQEFNNGVPIYYTDPDTGERLPKQNIYFRRMGTADDNTSYFKFKEEKKNYTVEEITSGDPRWWNTPEVQQMIREMNYTLSNSKYIQLSTTMDMDDIWWQTCILLRGLLDHRKETMFSNIGLSQSLNGANNITVFEAALVLIIMMTWNHSDFMGNHFNGNLYLPNGGIRHQSNLGKCVDMLFNGLNEDGSPKELKEGWPYQVSSFNYEIKEREQNRYNTLKNYEYLQPELMNMLDPILDREDISIGQSIMSEVKMLFKFLETKLRESSTIREFRQVTDAYNWLFLVNPYREDWYSQNEYSTTALLMKSYGISIAELNALYRFFRGDNYTMYSDNMSDLDYGELTDTDKIITFYRNIDVSEFDYEIPKNQIETSFGLPDDAQLGIVITQNNKFNHILNTDDDTLISCDGIINDTVAWSFNIRLSDFGEITDLKLTSFHGNPNDIVWKFDKIVLSSDSNDTELNFNFTMYLISDKTKEEIEVYKILNPNTNVLEEYSQFGDTKYVQIFRHALDRWSCQNIYNSPLAPILKTNYKNIISDKIMLDISNTQYGPRSFEALLYLTNPQLYRLIQNLYGDGEQLLVLMRSMIRALENYVQSPLPALEFEATGQQEYIRILKEVITYFKSYMVEFTKSEFQYIFGGLFDHGGNSNMLLLFDEINHITIRMLPKDALHLYDVSCAKARVIVNEDVHNFIYDEALFQIKATYGVLKTFGYPIWFDDGEKIEMLPFQGLLDETELIAEIIPDSSVTYKIVIHKELSMLSGSGGLPDPENDPGNTDPDDPGNDPGNTDPDNPENDPGNTDPDDPGNDPGNTDPDDPGNDPNNPGFSDADPDIDYSNKITIIRKTKIMNTDYTWPSDYTADNNIYTFTSLYDSNNAINNTIKNTNTAGHFGGEYVLNENDEYDGFHWNYGDNYYYIARKSTTTNDYSSIGRNNYYTTGETQLPIGYRYKLFRVNGITPTYNAHFEMTDSGGNARNYFVDKLIVANITSVTDRAFYGCQYMKLIVGDGVTKISAQAFGSQADVVRKVKSVEISSSVSTIDMNAFEGKVIETMTIHKTRDSISNAPWGAEIGSIIWDG